MCVESVVTVDSGHVKVCPLGPTTKMQDKQVLEVVGWSVEHWIMNLCTVCEQLLMAKMFCNPLLAFDLEEVLPITQGYIH